MNKVKSLAHGWSKYGKYLRFEYIAAGLVVAALLVPRMTGGGIFARYVHQQTATFTVTAAVARGAFTGGDGDIQTFSLGDEPSTPVADDNTLILAEGFDNTALLLCNYEGGNWMLPSEVEMTYTIVVRDNSGEKTKATLDRDSVTLPANTAANATIAVGNLTAGHSYTVTATSTGAYARTLSVVIVVPETTQAVYKSLHVDEGAGKAELTVWSVGYDGDITVTAPSSLTQIEPMTTKTITLGSGSSYVYQYTGNLLNLKVDSFTVTYGNGRTATAGGVTP